MKVVTSQVPHEDLNPKYDSSFVVRCYDLHAAPFLSFPPPGRKDFFHALGTLYRQIPVISEFLISTVNSKIKNSRRLRK